jgi:hypothetical protein
VGGAGEFTGGLIRERNTFDSQFPRFANNPNRKLGFAGVRDGQDRQAAQRRGQHVSRYLLVFEDDRLPAQREEDVQRN